MKQIYYGKNPPKSFFEEISLDAMHPYCVRIKSLPNDDVAPPHYSDDTLEILFCDQVAGEFLIENRKYRLDGCTRHVFVVPPKAVHSNHFYATERGMLHVLHLSLNYILDYININRLLDFAHHPVEQLIFSQPDYEQLFPHILRLIEQDENVFACMCELICILELLCRSIPSDLPDILPGNSADSARLRDLIQWTAENYIQRFDIGEVAAHMGFSKTYLCSWFKRTTGITYLKYLNQMRISQACRHLISGMTVSETALACGFSDLSYFIQLFKKIMGCTPKAYVNNDLRDISSRPQQAEGT